jgi:hypothetical protein
MGIYIFFIIISSFGLVVLYFQLKEDKQRITNYLHDRGATNVIVSTAWLKFDFDKTLNTYNVKYTNSQGMDCQRSCRIRSFFSDEDEEIYWSAPP